LGEAGACGLRGSYWLDHLCFSANACLTRTPFVPPLRSGGFPGEPFRDRGTGLERGISPDARTVERTMVPGGTGRQCRRKTDAARWRRLRFFRTPGA
jgi:hypothetical protein